ncbi:hypothetical protein ATCC90586_001991 [Pythium insidiosum]|nr:hypothetical protein ATCC90586_001991 [Pythium insidiosum]
MRRFTSAAGGTSLTLCADFDQTITTKDTIALLFEAAASKHADTHARQQHDETVRALVDAYVSESNQLAARFRDASTTSAESFDAVGLDAFLRSYSEMDLRSIRRVERSKALRGIKHEDLLQLSASVQLMTACPQVLQKVSRVRVISANWSARLLQDVLTPIANTHPDMQVLANGA